MRGSVKRDHPLFLSGRSNIQSRTQSHTHCPDASQTNALSHSDVSDLSSGWAAAATVSADGETAAADADDIVATGASADESADVSSNNGGGNGGNGNGNSRKKKRKKKGGN